MRNYSMKLDETDRDAGYGVAQAADDGFRRYFLAFPGGIGTLEEISQVMSQVKLHQMEGRFAFLDFDGYYQHEALIQQMSDEASSTRIGPTPYPSCRPLRL